MNQQPTLNNGENEIREPKDLLSMFSALSSIPQKTSLIDIIPKHQSYADINSAITVDPPADDKIEWDLSDVVMLHQRRRTRLPPRDIPHPNSISAPDHYPMNSINLYEKLSIKPEDTSNENETPEISQEKDRSTTSIKYVYKSEHESYKWPPISEFRPEAVPALVKKYIECWKLDPVFKFHIRPLESKNSTCSNLYGAEVVFSAPTPSCPNPQFNVSVYFKFEVSKVAPKTLPVHVSYHFEGQRQVHVADNRFTFQEGVLILLMKCKMKIFSKLRF